VGLSRLPLVSALVMAMPPPSSQPAPMAQFEGKKPGPTPATGLLLLGSAEVCADAALANLGFPKKGIMGVDCSYWPVAWDNVSAPKHACSSGLAGC
jgi:hypothetical protein